MNEEWEKRRAILDSAIDAFNARCRDQQAQATLHMAKPEPYGLAIWIRRGGVYAASEYFGVGELPDDDAFGYVLGKLMKHVEVRENPSDVDRREGDEQAGG